MAIGNTGLSIIACTVASSVNKLKFYIHVEMCQPAFFPKIFPILDPRLLHSFASNYGGEAWLRVGQWERRTKSTDQWEASFSMCMVSRELCVGGTSSQAVFVCFCICVFVFSTDQWEASFSMCNALCRVSRDLWPRTPKLRAKQWHQYCLRLHTWQLELEWTN